MKKILFLIVGLMCASAFAMDDGDLDFGWGRDVFGDTDTGGSDSSADAPDVDTVPDADSE